MPSLLFVHALSPLHAGTGHAVGAVDLPIARDKATGFPYVPGSSIKGVLRDTATRENGFEVSKIFGPDRDSASEHAGALLVGDATLALLPARSLVGTFAWVTSPWLLRRLARDAREAGLERFAVPEPASVDRACVATPTALLNGNRVIFEDLDFLAAEDEVTTRLAAWLGARLFPGDDDEAKTWRALLSKKLCVLHDDAMAYFSEHGTQIVTRIAIDPEKKTVKDGALWTEESLPTESVLVSLVAGQRVGAQDANGAVASLKKLIAQPVQLGGDATTGRGRCRLVLAGGAQ